MITDTARELDLVDKLGLVDHMPPQFISKFSLEFLYNEIDKLRFSNDSISPEDVIQNQGAIKILKRLISRLESYSSDVDKLKASGKNKFSAQ